MASSGSVNSVTFTPNSDGTIVVTADFSAQRVTGGDWGSGAYYRLYCTQDGVTTYSDQLPLSTTRISYSATGSFEIVSGLEVVIGLFGGVSGASEASFWNIKIVTEFRKR